MGKRKGSFWDDLAWVVLGLITLWLILKTFGVINTPLWLQYSPLYGAIYLAGWTMKKLDTATEDIKNIKSELKDVQNGMQTMEKDIILLKQPA